ncbi:Nop14 family protein (macronuclear) [Tetrahymena thermophila SB210]|uniref:Nop14 family protein n=1 Tax=Tetrahymena thermophila (strain SB210) TaxID=312017 RepID=I7M6B6_TETTS|nr:Nop14 family protein [Tetrahymena thermophila SB210]EAR84911.2 Nop14 family protein [Tetrahymena thermophila SB210]|eukprot:XP_001032574.2 Nop14 family protein [Tetrahymena thermophila SB210]
MGKVKQIDNNKAPDQKKKITKTNSFGKYASNKQVSKETKLYANKSLFDATLTAEKKVNQFKDSRLIEMRKQQKQSTPDGRLSAILMKGAQKKKKFDLDSDGENEDAPLKLTHKGKEIEELDDFKDQIDFSDAEDNIPAEIVDKLNFAGFEKQSEQVDPSNPQKKKSKKEIYEEIIKKSKQAKYERQKQREDDKTLLQDVNDGYDDIRDLLQFRGYILFNKCIFINFVLIYNRNYKADEYLDVDEFDKLTKELQTDIKTQANTVIKKVEDKKEKKLQEKRRKQLKGIMSSDGEEDQDLNNDDELQSKTRRELGILKHMRKVENLNKFIDQIKQVKQKSKKGKEGDEENDEEYDSLDEIDLDEQQEEYSEEDSDGDDEDDDVEHLELEDEYESNEEEEQPQKQKSKSNTKNNKQKTSKIQQESEEDDEEDDDEDLEEEEGDEDEELDSDEFDNESD